MGHVHDRDDRDEHEGWVAMTYADGAVSSGTSNGLGHYPEGYTYDPERPGRIVQEPRPFSDTTGWVPRCECGWLGIVHPVIETGTDADRWREPSADQEALLMDQWRLHIRDVIPGAYPSAPAALRAV